MTFNLKRQILFDNGLDGQNHLSAKEAIKCDKENYCCQTVIPWIRFLHLRVFYSQRFDTISKKKVLHGPYGLIP